ncbi:MAG: hypothetical protein M3178_11405 [Pseudomonadota bacterium]|nr:hypothetical protein [Pseudomonadota bacterium]
MVPYGIAYRAKDKAANTLMNAAKTRKIPLAASPALALDTVTFATRPETRPGAAVHRAGT